MNDVFMQIPKELDSIRAFPRWGSWAMLVGFFKLQGRAEDRLPPFCKKLGLRRMDIIWVEDERVPSSYVHALTFRRRNGLKSFEGNDKDEIERMLDEKAMCFHPGQLTILRARVGHSETVRFYVGELSPISQEKLDYYLSENCLTPSTFTERETGETSVLMEEALRDLVDSMRLDGLSRSEAVEELLSLDEISISDKHDLDVDMKQRKPNHYYKVRDEVFNAFH